MVLRIQARLVPAPDEFGARAESGIDERFLFDDWRFTLAQRVVGWNLNPETRLGRVYYCENGALEAEGYRLAVT